MAHGKRWPIIPVLSGSLCLVILGYSQSDETAGTRTSTATAKADSAPAPKTAAGPSTPLPASSGASLTMEARGQVISADPANKTLVVRSQSGAITFEVQERLANDLQDLRPGDKMTVRYTLDVGKYSAEAIQKG